MDIYVVQSGDSLWKIANSYGMSVQELVTVNGVSDPNQLVVGQALVIPKDRFLTYTVKSGDTLWGIAKKFGVSVSTIGSLNQITNSNQINVGQDLQIPTDFYTVKAGDSLYAISRKLSIPIKDLISLNQISNPSQIHIGQRLILPGKTKPLVEVNGYTARVGQSEIQEIQSIGNSLTYLSPFSYHVQDDGTLLPLSDSDLLTVARTEHVAPLLVITNFKNGHFDSDLAHTILNDQTLQEQLLKSVKQTLQAKKQFGLNIDFEYVYPEDREPYNAFLRKVVSELHPLGYSVSTAIAPKAKKDQVGLLYEAHDYAAHGQIVDFVVIMTYEWGYSGGAPMAVSPLKNVKQVIDYALTEIPAHKILMGVPLYGYDWKLPYIKGGQLAQTLSPLRAVERAAQYKVNIQYDEPSESPYYNYTDANGTEHVVWFEDARSVNAKYDLVKQYNLRGVSYWVLGNPFPQNWYVLNDHFRIQKF